MNSLQNRSTLLDKQYDTGQFSACIVTNIGKEMIAKSQNGQTLTFTRVALGDGLIDDDDDILSFTKVKNERLSANIAKWVDKQNGQFQIQFRVSNQEVEIGFWQREIGIMAKIDGGEEQLVNINSDYKGELGKLQAEHIITTQSRHLLDKKGRHTLRIRPLDPALVMQKIMIDLGGLKPSFLGAPESLIKE